MIEAEDATLLTAEPQIFVTDMEAALAFYVDRLRFAPVFSYGEPPFYAQVKRGGARLNLRFVHAPAFDLEFRAREEDPLSAMITVEGVEQLFAEFERGGLTFHQRLRREPRAARTFIVQDPVGNLIGFAGE